MIICPHCQKSFELEDSVKVELEAHLKEELDQKLKIKDEEIQKFKDQELKLLKIKSELESRQKDLDLELERKLDERAKAIQMEESKRQSEHFTLLLSQRDKQLEDMKKALEEAQRKGTTVSQQLQGEVLELDLEAKLRDSFKDDDIEPVGKGVLGADVRQVVKTSKGTICGTILWEFKRTKNWSSEWIGKLRSDQLSDKADLAVIISTSLPENITNFGQDRGVTIAKPDYLLPIAAILREQLIGVARQKFLNQNQTDNASVLYRYITSTEFAQAVDMMATTYKEMLDSLDKERTAFERIWKSREIQIKKLISGVSGIYGSLQGAASLPNIKSLSLPE